MEKQISSFAPAIEEMFTFDDVLLVPAYSQVLPREVNIESQLTTGIRLNAPVVSAAMDTVTEKKLAIAIAREGGIGMIHDHRPNYAQSWCHSKRCSDHYGPVWHRRHPDY